MARLIKKSKKTDCNAHILFFKETPYYDALNFGPLEMQKLQSYFLRNENPKIPENFWQKI